MAGITSFGKSKTKSGGTSEARGTNPSVKKVAAKKSSTPSKQKPEARPAHPKEKIPLDNYEIKPENWFTNKPYGFRFTNRDGKTLVMFLPISPSNLTVTTQFATNIIPTLYGTVEEHSDVRYYDISIEGTTGFAPRYVMSPDDPYLDTDASIVEQDIRKPGRRSFEIATGVAAGGFFSKTLGVLDQIASKINKAIDKISPNKQKTAVYTLETGYYAFHNLYKFFLKYKHDVSGADGKSGPRKGGHPLTFFNYKDNNEYSVAIRGFTLKRSAENPMLYYYSIQMRGYALRTAGSKVAFGDEMGQRLKDLGLNGINPSSLLGDIKNVAKQATSVAGLLGGGLNVFGR
jgi:hypothetical protein